MAKTSDRGAHLPEPSHPFARWLGGAAIGIWALGVQSFGDPWNKLGAILSPGVGYVLGHAVQVGIDYCVNMSSTRRRRIDLENATQKIDRLYEERDKARANGAGSEVINYIEQVIVGAQKDKLRIIQFSSIKKTKKSLI